MSRLKSGRFTGVCCNDSTGEAESSAAGGSPSAAFPTAKVSNAVLRLPGDNGGPGCRSTSEIVSPAGLCAPWPLKGHASKTNNNAIVVKESRTAGKVDNPTPDQHMDCFQPCALPLNQVGMLWIGRPCLPVTKPASSVQTSAPSPAAASDRYPTAAPNTAESASGNESLLHLDAKSTSRG